MGISKQQGTGLQRAYDTKMREHEQFWGLQIIYYKVRKLSRNWAIKRQIEKVRFHPPDYTKD